MSAAAATGPVARPTVRIPYWDNARFAVIALVVVGHAILPQIPESDFARTVYFTLYAFHMPAFAFISGYFSKATPPGRVRMRKIVTQLVIPYIVLQTVWSVIQYFVEGDAGFNPTLPHWTLWFLIALAIFRVLLPYLAMLRWPLLWAVLASALVGYFENVDSTFALSRTIGILPYFLLGWEVRKWGLAERWFALSSRTIWLVRAAAIALFAGFATLVALTLEPMREFGLRDWLLYDDSYRDLGDPIWWAALLRLAFMVIAVVLATAFFSLVPRRRTWMTALGAGTMYVYLLHSFVLYPLRESGFLAEHAEPLWVLATIVFAILLAIVLATPPVRRAFRWLVEPQANWLFKPIDAHHSVGKDT